MSDIATVLHISDLHFVEDLETEGRRWRTRAFLAKSHSFGKLRALNKALYELEKAGRMYDLVLATGDLTTDGSKEAFRTALEFIEQAKISRGDLARLVAYGLG